jgi:YD repeat-containing protein
MKPILKKFWLTVGFLAFARLCAQVEDTQTGVPVRIWANAVSGPDSVDVQSGIASGSDQSAPSGATTWKLNYRGTPLTLWYIVNVTTVPGTLTVSCPSFLPWSLPGMSAPATGYASQTATAASQYTSMSLDLGIVRVVPGKNYTISIDQGNIASGALNVAAPPGYRVVLNNMPRNSCSVTTGNVVLRVLPALDWLPGPAGAASSVAALKVDWRLSLGSLLNGDAAGYLELADTGAGATWGNLLTPGALSYEATSSEVFVYQQNGAIRQIIANQVALDVVTLSSTSYEIRCYNPAQIQSYVPCSFSGQPFATYRIEQGTPDSAHSSDSTAVVLKFTRETRNIPDPNATNVPITRTETMSLQRTGTAPNFQWIKNDWTVAGQSPLVTTTVQSSGTAPSRAETISVAAAGGPSAMKLTRNYQTVASGEELTGETVGATNARTVGFSYYTDVNQPGSFGYIKNASLPGGGWEAYDYYDTSSATSYQIGQIKFRYRPFGNAPASSLQDATQGEVTYYEYATDPFGFRTRIQKTQTFVNGIETARSTVSYGIGVVVGATDATQTTYTSNGSYLQTVTSFNAEDTADAFYRGKVVAVRQPDGTRQNTYFERGSWNGTAFTPGSPSVASRISVITGRVDSANGGATQLMSPPTGNWNYNPICVISGKSTMEVTIRDERALTVRTESSVWNGTSWQLVSYVNYAYNFMGLLTSKTASNGATYTAAYDGLLKTSETDENGVTMGYLYDAAGRVQYSTRQGAGTLGSVTTRFSYDASGNVLEQRVGYGLTEQLVSAKQFDDGGRVIAETPAGLGTTTHAYDVANRMHTATKPDGGTLIEAVNLDGTPASKAGTSVVPQYLSYGIEIATGRRWTRTNTGTATSPRWQQAYKDWAGRDSAVVKPIPGSTATVFDGNFSSTGIFSKQFYYDDFATTGTNTNTYSKSHLTKTTETGMAPTLFVYDLLGRVTRTGLDIDGNGTLDLVSSDRITEKDQYFELLNGAWWSHEESRAYTTTTSSTPAVMAVKRSRLSGFPANRLAETQETDTNGNVTTQTKDIARATATATITTATSGIAQAQVETQINGLTTKVVGHDGLATTMGYDALMRKVTVTDARSNTTTSAYISGSTLVATVKDGTNTLVATNTYDGLGRQVSLTDAGGFHTYTSYNVRGQTLHQWGEAALPVEYGYDANFGDKTTMSTFRAGTGWNQTNWPGTGTNTSNSPGTADTTTWAYDAATGVQLSKTDALNHAIAYSYNARGQLATRTWARGVVTTYAYDMGTAEQRDILYSDSTPSLHYTFNRLGQETTIQDVTGTRTLAHCICGKLASEQLDAGFYGSRLLTYKLDQSTGSVLGRTVGYTLTASGTVEQDLVYRYETATGRFSNLSTSSPAVVAASHTFNYAYLANSDLLGSLSVDGGANPFTITRTFETQRDVLTSIEAKWSTASRTRYDYVVNALGQRTSAKQSGDAFADYGDATFRSFAYDAKGELTSDSAYLGSAATSGQELPDRQHAYSYDIRDVP